MHLDDVPKWMWIAGGGAILVALVLARKSGPSGPPAVTLAPAMVDPNAEATAQTALNTRASVFASLASGVLGYERDVGVAGIQATRDIAVTDTAGRVALGESYYNTVQTQLREKAMTDRTALETGSQVMIARTQQEGESARTFSNNETGLSIAGIQDGLGRYLSDASVTMEANRNRTALSIQESEAGVQRQASTNMAVSGGFKAVCNGVVGFFTLGLAHC